MLSAIASAAGTDTATAAAADTATAVSAGHQQGAHLP
jgi:hypothetical protein